MHVVFCKFFIEKLFEEHLATITAVTWQPQNVWRYCDTKNTSNNVANVLVKGLFMKYNSFLNIKSIGEVALIYEMFRYFSVS